MSAGAEARAPGSSAPATAPRPRNTSWSRRPVTTRGSATSATARRSPIAYTADNAKIQTWSYGGGLNQQWQPVADANGYYHFINRNSGKCLEVPASTADSPTSRVHLQRHRSAELQTAITPPTPPPHATLLCAPIRATLKRLEGCAYWCAEQSESVRLRGCRGAVYMGGGRRAAFG